MKALSLKQPWANLVACGYKTLETRTWATGYRGELLICSSASGDIEPTGRALAVVNLVECREMEEDDAPAACIRKYPDAKVFVLEDIRLLRPFPARGSLNIYDLEVSGEELICEDEAGVAAFIERYRPDVNYQFTQECIAKGEYPPI